MYVWHPEWIQSAANMLQNDNVNDEELLAVCLLRTIISLMLLTDSSQTFEYPSPPMRLASGGYAPIARRRVGCDLPAASPSHEVCGKVACF